MRRREFIGLLGGATAWPLAARAQQPVMPVIGFFHLTSLELTRELLAAFHQGLGDTGYIEGRRSNTGGQRVKTIDYPPWSPNWFAVRYP